MSRLMQQMACGVIALLALSQAAGAQLLGVAALPQVNLPAPAAGLPIAGPALQNILSTPGAKQAISPTLDSVGDISQSIANAPAADLLELRRLRLEELIRKNPSTVESDGNGNPVRRGVLVVIDPDQRGVDAALRLGFSLVSTHSVADLGLATVTLAVPRGMSAKAAIKLLRKQAPELQADFDHLYQPSGGSLAPVVGGLAQNLPMPSSRTIGMIDGGVASHPSLSGKNIEQSGFAGRPQPTGHGTAIASLLVGSEGLFHGAATGARLLVADVYGGDRAAGSATSIVQAIGWLAARHCQVINISLVGPPNRLVERAIEIVQSRGIVIVAAVGNDGPAAPPQYPASYPAVVSVTAVDPGDRALPEAGRPLHLDFAAPGADMAAALPGQGYTRVRGTSFAAPLVAGRLLSVGSIGRLAGEAQPGKGRVGRGVICGACRIDPRSLHIR